MGAKAEHPVGGTINGRQVRGTIAGGGSGWAFTVGPMWMRDTGVAAGDDVIIELAPEGPQRGDLADDIAAALDASPAAAAFFDTLAQFYRKAYLRWIDATTRRPDLRAARIAEVVGLLAAGIKQRPRSPQQSIPPDRPEDQQDRDGPRLGAVHAASVVAGAGTAAERATEAPTYCDPSDRRGVVIQAARGRGAEVLRLYLADSGMNTAMDQICAGYDDNDLQLLTGFLRRTADAARTAAERLTAS